MARANGSTRGRGCSVPARSKSIKLSCGLARHSLTWYRPHSTGKAAPGKGNRGRIHEVPMATQQRAWPTEIRLHKDRSPLPAAFASGERFASPAEYLRVKSPSAEVQGHAPEERKT